MGFPVLRPLENGFRTASGPGKKRKPWLFHIFFHSCGKLRGETLRLRFCGGREEGTVAHGARANNGSDCRARRFDKSASGPLLSRFLRCYDVRSGVRDHERNFPAKPPASPPDAWLSRQNGHQERTVGVETPPGEGAQAADGFLVLSRRPGR